MENELLYGQAFEMSDEAMKDDFLIPIGKAKVEREGTDVTLVAHSLSVQKALDSAKAMENDGISCEVSYYTMMILVSFSVMNYRY